MRMRERHESPLRAKRAQHAASLRARFLELSLRNRVGDDARAGSQRRARAVDFQRANQDVHVHAAVEIQIAERAGVRAARHCLSSSAMISMQRTFGQPVIVPPGNTAASTSPGVTSVRRRAAHVRHDVMHVRVGLDRHELVDLHGAGLADAAEIVALQVDQHHVLGALLRMRVQLASERRSAAASAPRGRVPAIGRVATQPSRPRPGAPATS